MRTKFPRAVAIQQRALAVLRIVTGLCFLYAFWQQLGGGLVGTLARAALELAEGNPVGFYADFLRQSVAGSGMGYAYFLLLSELLVGILLVLGLFTGPAALLGLLLTVNMALAFASLGSLVVGFFVLWSVVLAVLAVSFAGTTWGLDKHLIDRMPHWLVGLLHFEYREF
ncbi:MAG: DoxX family membrane protein [Candidatus Sericytochromatia bacterium]